MPQQAPIAVYGASGYTGRRVAAELSKRGRKVVLAGRNREALEEVASGLVGAEVRGADVRRPEQLLRAFQGCAAVVNCAGPFANTGPEVIEAALAREASYLDTTAEQAFMRDVFDTFGPRARESGITLVPGMSFYYALGDLLAHLVATGMGPLEEVIVSYGVRGWRLTRGSRLTALGISKRRTVYEEGRWGPAPVRLGRSAFRFPAPLGLRPVIEYPGGEVLTVPRHVATRRVVVLMSAEAFAGRLARLLPGLSTGVAAPWLARAAPLFNGLIGLIPDRASQEERAASDFVIVVRVRSSEGERTGSIRGRDIYGLGAIIAAEAVTRLPGAAGGAWAPSELFPPRGFLDALAPAGVTYQVGAESEDRDGFGEVSA